MFKFGIKSFVYTNFRMKMFRIEKKRIRTANGRLSSDAFSLPILI